MDVRRCTQPRDWREATALVHDHVEWMRGWTDFDPLDEQPALHTELADLAMHYRGADAAVFVARWHDVAVGTVAVRCHADRTAELKRMYVRPYARGKGVADRLVDAAMSFASAATRSGWRRCAAPWTRRSPCTAATGSSKRPCAVRRCR